MSVNKVDTLSEFNTQLEKAGSKLVVVDFYADWCGPCKMIAPKVVEMAKQLGDTIVFLKVDVDSNDETAEKYSISAMPTFLFIKNKEKLESFAGANEAKLREMIEKFK